MLVDGIFISKPIEELITNYIDVALDYELNNKLEQLKFPFKEVRLLKEYKTFSEIEALAHAAFNYYLYSGIIKK